MSLGISPFLASIVDCMVIWNQSLTLTLFRGDRPDFVSHVSIFENREQHNLDFTHEHEHDGKNINTLVTLLFKMYSLIKIQM